MMKSILFFIPLLFILLFALNGSAAQASPNRWSCEGLNVADSPRQGSPMMGKFTASLELPEGDSATPVEFSWDAITMKGTLRNADQAVFPGRSYIVRVATPDEAQTTKAVLTAAGTSKPWTVGFVLKGLGADSNVSAFLWCGLKQ